MYEPALARSFCRPRVHGSCAVRVLICRLALHFIPVDDLSRMASAFTSLRWLVPFHIDCSAQVSGHRHESRLHRSRQMASPMKTWHTEFHTDQASGSKKTRTLVSLAAIIVVAGILVGVLLGVGVIGESTPLPPTAPPPNPPGRETQHQVNCARLAEACMSSTPFGRAHLL